MTLSDHKMIAVLVQSIIERPEQRNWTIQGLGMLRTYLDEDKVYRLHIWDNRFKVPNVSELHDHPWDFDSYIISGHIQNAMWEPGEGGSQFQHVKIICGEGGCSITEPDTVTLISSGTGSYPAGSSYTEKAEAIHKTYATNGTITVVRREIKRKDQTANIYWKEGPWVSAEPVFAPLDMVQAIVQPALKQLKEIWK